MDSDDQKRTQDEFEPAVGGLVGWMNKFKLATVKPPLESMRIDKEGLCHWTFDFAIDGLEYTVPLKLERKNGTVEGGGFTLHVDNEGRSFDLKRDGSPTGTASQEIDRAAEDIADAMVEAASGPSE
jgi:hypothetical protein